MSTRTLPTFRQTGSRWRPTLAAALLAVLAAGPAAADAAKDPWQRLNRATYAFNDALDRMLAHPAAVVRQVAASLAWQVAGSPYDDVPGFHSAASDVATGDWTLGVPAFPNLATWFDGHPPRHHGGSIAPMLTVVSGTLRLAQVLLWLALAGSLVRLVQRWGRRRRGQRS
jgi:hypothetical protein